jgi:hypothetical protein
VAQPKTDYTVTVDEITDRPGWCRVKIRDGGEWRYCRNRSDGNSLLCIAHGGRAASARAVITPRDGSCPAGVVRLA